MNKLESTTRSPVYLLAWIPVLGIALTLMAMTDSKLGGVLAPLLAACAISTLFWRALTLRDQGLPIFDVGAFFMLAIAAYAVLPLAGYALSGMQLSSLSAGRLYGLNPEPEQFAEVGWMYVMLMTTFALGYLAWRRQTLVGNEPVATSRTTAIVVIVLWLLLHGVVIFFRVALGVNFSVAYDDSLYAAAASYAQLPLLARQLFHNAYGVLIILNVAIIVVLVAHWKSKLGRNVLFVWVAASCVDYLLNPGGRFALLSMLIAFAMAFHRFVRPIKISQLVFAGALLFLAFMAAGFARGGRSLLEQGQVMFDLLEGYQYAFTVSDEFQISYGSVLEFKQNLRHGVLDPIPWQIYASDLLMPIPQQILPFEKLDPVDWYSRVTGNPDYFSFGVLAQSVLGFGWAELALRGLLFGIALGIVHNWWARKPYTLWRTVFYVWLTIVSYQAVRNTSLYLVPLVVYRFLPLLLVVHVAEWLVEGAATSRPRPRGLD